MSNGAPTGPVNFSPDEARRHLEAICSSPVFAASKRSQEFLRYIVLETIEGRGDQIKERNIAHQVFGKGVNFEPEEHSLVRVKAGEVRKRLSDYYQSAPRNGIRIELPTGGYVPVIVPTHQAETPVPPEHEEPQVAAKPLNRRRLLWSAAGLLGAVGAGSLTPLLLRKNKPIDLLWKPVFATRTPLLIFLPVMRQKTGELTEWVGIGPAASLRRAADFLTEHRYPYNLRLGAELTFAQLREQPSLLLGGFDMDWTLRMTKDLRFGPLIDPATPGRAFIDRRTQQTWRTVRHDPNPYVDEDYGILCRLFDSVSGQIVFLAVGTQTFGTEGAANYLFDPDLFASLVSKAPADWETKNFQAVVHVSVIGTTISSPSLVATHFW